MPSLLKIDESTRRLNECMNPHYDDFAVGGRHHYEKRGIRGEVLIGKDIKIDPKTGMSILGETIFRKDFEPNEILLSGSIFALEKMFNVTCGVNIEYLNNIMNDNNIGIKFHKEIDEIELKNMESNYDILSIMKMKNKEYSNKFLEEFITKSQEHLYIDGIVGCPYTEKNVIKDVLILVPKNELINTI